MSNDPIEISFVTKRELTKNIAAAISEMMRDDKQNEELIYNVGRRVNAKLRDNLFPKSEANADRKNSNEKGNGK